MQKNNLPKNLMKLKKSADPASFLGAIREFFPHCISICVNYDCNLRCRHCDVPRTKDCPENPKLISADEWTELIRQFAAKEGKIASIIYREPLFNESSRKKVFSILKECNKLGLRCGLVNNGSFFTEFVGEFPDIKMDFIDFSIEGPRKIHEKIRIGSDYEKLKKAISLCRESNIAEDIFLALTINKLNYKNIGDLVDEFESFGVNHIFHTWMPTSEEFGNLYLSEDVYFNQILPKLSEISRKKTVILDVLPRSFSNFPSFFSHISHQAKFYMEDSYIYAKYGDLTIRFVNTLQSLLELMVVSPEGKIISMEERYLTKDSLLRKTSPDAKSVLEKARHPNLEMIERRLYRIPYICFSKSCFPICLGQNSRCPNVVKKTASFETARVSKGATPPHSPIRS